MSLYQGKIEFFSSVCVGKVSDPAEKLPSNFDNKNYLRDIVEENKISYLKLGPSMAFISQVFYCKQQNN